MTSLDGVAAGPMEMAAQWLPGGPNPCVMTLSTLDEGTPDSRTVVLSLIDAEGFHFHTDAASRKVTHIAADPHVALTILLAEQSRQVVVQGTAAQVTSDEAAQAYADRSPYLKQLAWLNTHEFAMLPEDERQERWAAFAAEHGDDLTPAPGWIGFRVTPTRVSFWSGAPDTASRRLEYRRGPGGWETSLRAG
ncbi:pyridoxal 5'-phosphate synthase [Demequina sp. NBRC 110055]|uniref:pyridoxine/pyridoxamine 5'-phosphate oxidase n=1 Tax=Demequina sp. NBRC 110055 TaxID=1570344 RepID=UPI000A014833|nr:pyridoxamine 5'-phosphate oxidase family protein [Demequina sp. NBRC 110055]